MKNHEKLFKNLTFFTGGTRSGQPCLGGWEHTSTDFPPQAVIERGGLAEGQPLLREGEGPPARHVRRVRAALGRVGGRKMPGLGSKDGVRSQSE